MVELRWVRRTICTPKPRYGAGMASSTELVLQYRTLGYVETWEGEIARLTEWTDWQDVPVTEESA